MWSVIVSWPVVAIVGPSIVLLGFGVLGMTPAEFKLALSCFAIGYLIILARIVGWIAFERSDSALERGLFVTLVFAAAGALWFASSMFALSKRPRALAESPAFSIDIRTAAVAKSGPLTFFMVGHKSGVGDAAAPIIYLVYAEITNAQDVASTISDISVAAGRQRSGPWEDLHFIPLEGNRLFALGIGTPYRKTIVLPHGTAWLATPMKREDMKMAALLDPTPTLESWMQKPILPHHTVRGWIAWDSPSLLGYVGFLRFTVRDTVGKGGSYIVELPRRNPQSQSAEINVGTLKVLGLTTDISHFYVHPFSKPIAATNHP